MLKMLRLQSICGVMIRRNLNLTGVRGVAAPAPASGPKKPAVRPEFEKFLKLQQHYQKDDGKPIFLKAGARDQLLYRTTMALTVLGLLLDLNLYIVMALK